MAQTPIQQFEENPFAPATKYEAYLRLAILGASGNGKTFTALTLASFMSHHLGIKDPKIFVIDTEHGSADKYSDEFNFQSVRMGPGTDIPTYHPHNYVSLIQAAEQFGADIIVVDSLSHAWNGPGGVLQIVDDAAQAMRNPNTFSGWRKGTPAHQSLVDAILNCNAHLIGTMRTKMKMTQEGRKIVKVGFEAIQRDGMEYEFDVVITMSQEHDAIVTKSRSSQIEQINLFKQPGSDLAKMLVDWVSGEKNPYIYGNNTPVPRNAKTRKIFNEYMLAHENEPPQNGDALGAWFADK